MRLLSGNLCLFVCDFYGTYVYIHNLCGMECHLVFDNLNRKEINSGSNTSSLWLHFNAWFKIK